MSLITIPRSRANRHITKIDLVEATKAKQPSYATAQDQITVYECHDDSDHDGISSRTASLPAYPDHAISPEALLSHSGRSPHPRMVASTDFFNFLTRTIEHSILLPQEACRRAVILNRWTKVASKLLLLSNYQTLKAIVSALGTPPVQRLRRIWECIPK
ncbi:unnamed protein product [Rhizopus stolonifer]